MTGIICLQKKNMTMEKNSRNSGGGGPIEPLIISIKKHVFSFMCNLFLGVIYSIFKFFYMFVFHTI